MAAEQDTRPNQELEEVPRECVNEMKSHEKAHSLLITT